MKAYLVILAVAASTSTGVAIHLALSRAQAPQYSPPAASISAPAVPVQPAPPAEEKLELEAKLEPRSEVDVRTNLVGRALRFKVEAGDFVQKGQLIIEIDDSKLQESVRYAETAFQLAQAEFQAQQARTAAVARNLQRQSELARTGAASASQRDELENRKRLAKADEDLTHSRVAQAESELQQAKQALAETKIVSPISGYVAQRLDSSALSSPDVVLIRIIDISALKTVVHVGEQAYPRVVQAQEARIAVDAFPNRNFVGSVVHKAPIVDPLTHTSAVFIEITNADNLLKPGMYARARLMFDDKHEPRIISHSKPDADRPGDKHLVATPKVNATATAAAPLPGLQQFSAMLGSMAAEKQRLEAASRVTADASKNYFQIIEKVIGEVRNDTKGSNTFNLEKTAERIDLLPILNVDDELITFASDVSKELRDIAERRRQIAREDAVPELAFGEHYQRAASAVKTQGMLKIYNGLLTMRRKMTKKYNLEFWTASRVAHAASPKHSRSAGR